MAAPSLGRAPDSVRLVLAVLIVPLVLATVAGLVLLWPDGDLRIDGPGADVQRGTGTVVDVHACRLQAQGCVAATVDLRSGPGSPGEVEALLPYGPGAPEVAAGDDIVVSTPLRHPRASSTPSRTSTAARPC